MNIKVLGIDLAKNVFQLHGVDERGKSSYSQPGLKSFTVIEV